MASIENYRQLIQEVIADYAEKTAMIETTVDRQLVFDTQHDHYQLINVGWQKEHRIYQPVLHLDIKNNKIWIQQNMTEVDIAEQLIARGIDKKEIVIGFHSPFKRQFTEYAVA